MKPDDDANCDVCRTKVFERNAYFYGKQFTVRDLLLEQRYLIEKRWLLNRTLVGDGVVCGLDVGWDADTYEFTVDIGLALDCCGREILVCEPQRLRFDDYAKLCEESGYAGDAGAAATQGAAEDARDEGGEPDDQHQGHPGHGNHKADRFILCLEYAECKTDEVYLPPLGCDDQERREFNHVRESFKLRLKRWGDTDLEPGGQVECLDWPTFDAERCRTEPLHQALCRREKGGCPRCADAGCLVLATIRVLPAGYGQRQREVKIDTCTYRKLVYRNPLLYELIYCQHGDLPHIVSLSWASTAHPDRMVEWEDFLRLIDDGLVVEFDQEMDPATLNPHTFVVCFLDRQEGTHGELVRRRIPGTVRAGRGDRCYEARFIADEKWVGYRLKSGDSPLSYGEDVEILIRGNNIRSRSGKALDGEHIRLPTGNGTPGGDFIDYFRVLKHGESKSAAKRYEDF